MHTEERSGGRHVLQSFPYFTYTEELQQLVEIIDRHKMKQQLLFVKWNIFMLYTQIYWFQLLNI